MYLVSSSSTLYHGWYPSQLVYFAVSQDITKVNFSKTAGFVINTDDSVAVSLSTTTDLVVFKFFFLSCVLIDPDVRVRNKGE